jgi:hypothetical protein
MLIRKEQEIDGKVLDIKASMDQNLASILNEQYQCTEAFCNATTALHNALLQHSGSVKTFAATGSNYDPMHLYQSSQEYQDALASVQTNLRLLESLTMSNSEVDDEHEHNDDSSAPDATALLQTRRRSGGDNPLNLSLRDHVARTRRILTTIYQSGQGASFHANGLPTTTSSLGGEIGGSGNAGNASRLVSLASLRASIETVTENLKGTTPS